MTQPVESLTTTGLEIARTTPIDHEGWELLHSSLHPYLQVDCMAIRNIAWADEAAVAAALRAPDSLADPQAFLDQYARSAAPNLVAGYEPEPGMNIVQYIDSLWPVLFKTTPEDTATHLAVTNEYPAPGERFVEKFYWDEVDVMRGFAAIGRWDLVRKMVQSNADLIDRLGYIPNATSRDLADRSQPPVFAEMVELLTMHDPEALTTYLPALVKEYNFWMRGSDQLPPPNGEHQVLGRVVRMADGELLNRYGYSNQEPLPDGLPVPPRPEALCNDKETVDLAVRLLGADPDEVRRDLRRGGESGWDFTSRWFADGRNIHTICTGQIVPVDLNCNLLKLEQIIALAYEAKAAQTDPSMNGNVQHSLEQAEYYRLLSENRAAAIQKYCWDEELGFFFDYNIAKDRRSEVWSMAGVYPMDMLIISQDQAARVIGNLYNKFLRPGGLATTLEETGQQWDGDNGWPLLQFRGIRAAWRYGYEEFAEEVRARFMFANEEVFRLMGYMAEKLDVAHPGQPGRGGEYKPQRGFSMTNATYLALLFKAFMWSVLQLAPRPHPNARTGFHVVGLDGFVQLRTQ